MADEPRQGIFLPDLEDISREWKVMLTAQSEAWQAKFDLMTERIDELLAELRALKGVTITIDRQ